MHWKDWCWSWNSNNLVTWCKEMNHWKRYWFWEKLKAGREGNNRGWDGWMASATQWTEVWVNSGNWWWTGRPGLLRFMGSQIVRHDWVTELSWCWERLRAGWEGDDRGWDGWMTSLTQWARVWVDSGSWWWTGGLACCDSWGHKELEVTELNWTESMKEPVMVLINLYCSYYGVILN